MKTLLAGMLILAFLPIAVWAQTATDIRARVARLGTGAKARVTVKLKDGTKVKGYLAEANNDNFVVRDQTTNAPTTIAYDDVAKVDRKKGNGKLIAALVGVGAGVVVSIILLRAVACDGGAGSGAFCH